MVVLFNDICGALPVMCIGDVSDHRCVLQRYYRGGTDVECVVDGYENQGGRLCCSRSSVYPCIDSCI